MTVPSNNALPTMLFILTNTSTLMAECLQNQMTGRRSIKYGHNLTFSFTFQNLNEQMRMPPTKSKCQKGNNDSEVI